MFNPCQRRIELLQKARILSLHLSRAERITIKNAATFSSRIAGCSGGRFHINACQHRGPSSLQVAPTPGDARFAQPRTECNIIFTVAKMWSWDAFHKQKRCGLTVTSDSWRWGCLLRLLFVRDSFGSLFVFFVMLQRPRKLARSSRYAIYKYGLRNASPVWVTSNRSPL